MGATTETPGLQRSLGPYRLLGVVGAGARGTVHRAVHVGLARHVAIKVLEPPAALDARLVRRFTLEARAANLIRHPNVIDITDIAKAPSGCVYFVMELLCGPSLKQIIVEDAPLDIDRVVDLGRQLACGIAAAHAAGVIHRDVKPTNVVVTKRPNGREHVKLVDFGVAKLVGEARAAGEPDLTMEGSLVGTPTHMPIEQVCGDTPRPTMDVYAFGVTLYEMLTAHLPYEEAEVAGTLRAAAKGNAPRVDLLRPDIPAPLADLVEDCMRLQPDDRPASMAEIIARLDAIPFETARRRRRRSVVSAVMITSIAALVTAASMWNRNGVEVVAAAAPEPPRPSPARTHFAAAIPASAVPASAIPAALSEPEPEPDPAPSVEDEPEVTRTIRKRRPSVKRVAPTPVTDREIGEKASAIDPDLLLDPFETAP